MADGTPPKRDRIVEVHFYEWRLLSWATSDTRDRLDAAGRGIYRELIDQCYAKGSFPADLDYIQRKCACTLAEYERTWPIIKKQFSLDKRKNEYRHGPADTFRRMHFSYIETQRNNGARGGRPAKPNLNGFNRIETSGFGVAKPGGYENHNPTESLNKEIKEEEPPTPFAADAAGQAQAPRQSKAPSELDQAISEVAAKIHSEHPKYDGRCDLGVNGVAKRLREIASRYPAGKRVHAVREVGRIHGGWCITPKWADEGMAKGLDNWLCPSKGRYEAEPPETEFSLTPKLLEM